MFSLNTLSISSPFYLVCKIPTYVIYCATNKHLVRRSEEYHVKWFNDGWA